MSESSAHVDDLLVRRHVLAHRLRRLLGSNDLSRLSLREYRLLLAEVRRLPADVRTVLEQLAHDLPPGPGELARELLTDLDQSLLPAPEAAPQAQVIDLHAGLESTAPQATVDLSPDERLRQAATDPAATAEEIALLWLEHFLVRPAERRLSVLENLLAVTAPRCAPLLRLEWNAGDLAGDPLIAALCERHFRLAEPPWLRYPRPGEPALAGAAKEAWAAAVKGTGHVVVVLDRPGPDRRHTFAVHLLDLANQGIEDAWGNARSDPRTLAAVLSHFAGMQPGVAWTTLPAPQAAALVQQAHALSGQLCHLVPPEFWIWSDLSATTGGKAPQLKSLWRTRTSAT